MPLWIKHQLPNTSVIVTVDDIDISCELLKLNVVEIIEQAGAIPDKVFVAFFAGESLWNATPTMRQINIPARYPRS